METQMEGVLVLYNNQGNPKAVAMRVKNAGVIVFFSLSEMGMDDIQALFKEKLTPKDRWKSWK